MNVDPGCNCYTQKVFLARVRWDKMIHVWEILVLLVFPLISLALFWLTCKLHPLSVALSAVSGCLGFFVCAYLMPLSKSKSYFLYMMAGKIMAYKHYDFGKNIIQPMFSWAFIAGLATFLIFLVLTELLLSNRSSKIAALGGESGKNEQEIT